MTPTAKTVEEKEAPPANEPEEELDEEGEEGGKTRYKPPRGSRDYGPRDMVIRNEMMRVIRDEFRKMGAANLETPVFELQQTLQSNYGEDEKLIYELKQQEGECLALRYDLTVPLCRYVAQERRNLKSTLRAARIGKVYRRDKPRMQRGRYREFYQCDLDIVRMASPTDPNDLVIDDAEIINMVCSVLTRLDVGDFQVRINNRKVFDAICLSCGIPEDKLKDTASAVDKLDKKPWEEVYCEMITEPAKGGKGLPPAAAKKLQPYVQKKGTFEKVLAELSGDAALMSNPKAKVAVGEMELLQELLIAYGWQDRCLMDMSMVRGLAYYTGFIMEAELTKKEVRKLMPLAVKAGYEKEAVEVGSISGGGRYDELVGKFKPGLDCPCTGASIGFGRIFIIKSLKARYCPMSTTTVIVGELQDKTNPGPPFLTQRIKIVQMLRDAGVSTELFAKTKDDWQLMLDYADAWGIPCVALIGETEVEKGTVNLRRLPRPGDMLTQKSGVEVEFLGIDETAKKPTWEFLTPKGKKQKLPKKVFTKISTRGGEATEFQVFGVPLAELAETMKRLYP